MADNRSSESSVLAALLSEHPRFHGRKQAGTQSWAIQPPVLRWFGTHLVSEARTLETGCGYSTVVLASLSATHIVISPFAEEHALIRTWCASHGVSTEHVQFLASPSQEVLPQLACGELDFVLIDGDHAFPAPFMDWYYTADSIREGGFVAVDDTQIPTGRILRDFLVKESTRWHLEDEIGKTAIFKRITGESVARGVMWMQQPYCQISDQGLVAKVRKRILGSFQ